MLTERDREDDVVGEKKMWRKRRMKVRVESGKGGRRINVK